MQNSRAGANRCVLSRPVTVVGSRAETTVRLHGDGVSPVHCVILRTPDALIVRDLGSESGTIINDEAIDEAELADGDILAIGPFRFRVRIVPGPVTPQTTEELADLADSFHTQAAAVVAQQAGLMDEEARIRQRKDALEQQETQLAGYLEEKRARLAELRDETRDAQAALHAARADHDAYLKQTGDALDERRRESDQLFRANQVDRQRLLALRRRMKHRWHRQWIAERAAYDRKYQDLEARRAEVLASEQQLETDRAALRQARLELSGEGELRRRELDVREAALATRETEFETRLDLERRNAVEAVKELEALRAAAAEAHRRHEAEVERLTRLNHTLTEEAAGLEQRIANQRQQLRDLGTRAEAASLASNLPTVFLPAAPAESGPPSGADPQLDAERSALGRIAGTLADQRQHLLEQCQRFIETRVAWEAEQEAVLSGLEQLARAVEEREARLMAMELDQAAATARLDRDRAILADTRRTLEGMKSRWAVEVQRRESEISRRDIRLRAQEEVAERRETILRDSRLRWVDRRRLAQSRFRRLGLAAQEAQLHSRRLLQGWLVRLEHLTRQRLGRATGTGTNTGARQETADPVLTDDALDADSSDWVAFVEDVVRQLSAARQQLDDLLSRLDERSKQLDRDFERLAAAETTLTERQAGWEARESALELEYFGFRRDIAALREERDRSADQMSFLRGEIERLALLLMNEPPVSYASAA